MMGRGSRLLVEALTRRRCWKTNWAAFSSSSSSKDVSGSYSSLSSPKKKASPQARVKDKELKRSKFDKTAFRPLPAFSMLGLEYNEPTLTSDEENEPGGIHEYAVHMGPKEEHETEEGLKKKYLQMLSSVIPSEGMDRVCIKDCIFDGRKSFRAMLTEPEAAKLKGHPEVVAVIRHYKFHYPAIRYYYGMPQGS